MKKIHNTLAGLSYLATIGFALLTVERFALQQDSALASTSATELGIWSMTFLLLGATFSVWAGEAEN